MKHRWPFYSPLGTTAPAVDLDDEPRQCNACEWIGPRSDCCWLGAVGPLCPECRETTEEAP